VRSVLSDILSPKAINATFTPSDRFALIQKEAFYLAERRGGVPGNEIEDWLLAESIVSAACGLLEPVPRWDIESP
jgi:hypothetical protein